MNTTNNCHLPCMLSQYNNPSVIPAQVRGLLMAYGRQYIHISYTSIVNVKCCSQHNCYMNDLNYALQWLKKIHTGLGSNRQQKNQGLGTLFLHLPFCWRTLDIKILPSLLQPHHFTPIQYFEI